MRILVTGGLGFIGSNFIRCCLREHPADSIVNLDLCTYAGNPANLADLRAGRRYRWIKGDIADPKAVDKAMRGVDRVIHFAAESHVDRSILEPGIFLRTNVTGTQVLLDAALRHKVKRFLHVSTDEVYGSVEKGHSKEGDSLLPNSPYAASKAASDLLVRSYVRTFGLPAIVTRASNNFGPYQFPEKALPLMITNWIEGKSFPLYGDGLNVRDWVYVEDHVRALDFLLRKGKDGEIYNIGGTRSMNNRELVEKVRKLMDVGPELVHRVEDRLGHDRRYAVDCSKLFKLGFKHAFSYQDALEATITWYCARENWWRPLKERSAYKGYYRKQYAKKG
ncbi:MAG: dTDP-glucose 4,6-dehydratase [Elusimicrobiota bacterium]|jgi:dTDP-glucose 4,6-dehydratase